MEYTPNHSLTQWEKTDRIRMEDFNANNFKLDQALDVRNCRIETGTYTGNKSTQTFTFSGHPVVVIFYGAIGANYAIIANGASIGLQFTTSGISMVSADWDGDSVTLRSYPGVECKVNDQGVTYYYAALVSLDS